MNLQESWESFTDLVNHEVKRNIPVRKAFNKKHKTPWMTRASLRSIKKNYTLSIVESRTNKESYENAKKLERS